MRDADYGGGSSYGAAFAPDGSLATTSFDGQIRLYPPGLAGPPLRRRAPGGERPFGIAFGADGARLAVGYDDSTRVDVLDGRSLAPLHPAATGGVDNGDLSAVAWAADGTLLAGGRYGDGTGVSPVLAWAAEGRGARRSLPAGQNTVMGLVPLPGGDLLVAAADPFLARLAPDGRAAWTRPLAPRRSPRPALHPPRLGRRRRGGVRLRGLGPRPGALRPRPPRAGGRRRAGPAHRPAAPAGPAHRGLGGRLRAHPGRRAPAARPLRDGRAASPCTPTAAASSSAPTGRCAPSTRAARRSGASPCRASPGR